MIRFVAFAALACLLAVAPASGQTAAPIKTLIVDGQNNHKNWPDTTRRAKRPRPTLQLRCRNYASAWCMDA